MEIDPPNTNSQTSNSTSTLSSSTLKRSSSAPMINVLGNSSSTREQNYVPSPLFLSIPRTRRFSASFSPGNPNSSPHSPSAVLPSRVSQIKHEEGMDMCHRETAHEKYKSFCLRKQFLAFRPLPMGNPLKTKPSIISNREVQSKLQISQSWEDLALDDNVINEPKTHTRCVTDPLHIFTSPFGSCNSPSPTRATKQCFSPSTCLPFRSSAFSTSPIPSPTRKTFATRRSQSPIALRPSHFSTKRKYDVEMETVTNPAKRLNLGPSSLHSPTSSLSSTSADAVNSPDQTVPQETLDMTDSMSTSSGSPSNTFKHLDPAPTTPQENLCRMDVSST